MKLGKSLAAGLVIGAFVALLICYVALDHNPQGEFADVATGVYTDSLYELFAITTAIVALPVAALLAVFGRLKQGDD